MILPARICCRYGQDLIAFMRRIAFYRLGDSVEEPMRPDQDVDVIRHNCECAKGI